MAKLAAELRANRALVTLLAACTAPRCSGIGPSPFTHAAHVIVIITVPVPGQLGLRIAGLPGHWVAGSQNVTKFHLWSQLTGIQVMDVRAVRRGTPRRARAMSSATINRLIHIECPVSITSYAKCPSGGDQPWVPRRSINVSSHRGTPTTN